MNRVNRIEIEAFENFMKEFAYDMTDQDDGELCLDVFYKYGPLTKQYWSYSPRILVCNLEPYGEAEGIIDFNIDIYVNDWMKKVAGYNAKTPRNTAKFIYGLIKSIDTERKEKIDFRSISDLDLICSMEKIAYLNFRVDQNTGQSKNAENSTIREQFENVTKDYIKKQIYNLNPQIIIISSKLGCELFNSCFKECNLHFKTVKKWDDKVVCSISHFSRVDYENFNE